MDNNPGMIELLIERAKEYGKTKFELYRLKAIEKIADTVSSVVSKLVPITIFILFFLILTIGVALWIGDLMGKAYLGFFVVALFYALAGFLLFYFRDSWIKSPVKNSLINKMLN